MNKIAGPGASVVMGVHLLIPMVSSIELSPIEASIGLWGSFPYDSRLRSIEPRISHHQLKVA